MPFQGNDVQLLMSGHDIERVRCRPPTPDLEDDTIPCVKSVKHLISELKKYESPAEQSSQHCLEVLAENPTADLELVNNSLLLLHGQDGIPEYDDILSVDNQWRGEGGMESVVNNDLDGGK